MNEQLPVAGSSGRQEQKRSHGSSWLLELATGTAVMTDLHHDKILILDFGAQYTQLVARRIREFGVYCEIWA